MSPKGVTVQRPSGFISRNLKRNPSWGKPILYSSIPVHKTMWELLLQSLHIDEDDRLSITQSKKVREFVRDHKRNRYIPEWVLEKFGVNLSFGAEDL